VSKSRMPLNVCELVDFIMGDNIRIEF